MYLKSYFIANFTLVFCNPNGNSNENPDEKDTMLSTKTGMKTTISQTGWNEKDDKSRQGEERTRIPTTFPQVVTHNAEGKAAERLL